MSDIEKQYKCSHCGNVKTLLINHDQLPEVWNRCTDQCMWVNGTGSVLYSAQGEKTGFRLCKYVRVKYE